MSKKKKKFLEKYKHLNKNDKAVESQKNAKLKEEDKERMKREFDERVEGIIEDINQLRKSGDVVFSHVKMDANNSKYTLASEEETILEVMVSQNDVRFKTNYNGNKGVGSINIKASRLNDNNFMQFVNSVSSYSMGKFKHDSKLPVNLLFSLVAFTVDDMDSVASKENRSIFNGMRKKLANVVDTYQVPVTESLLLLWITIPQIKETHLIK